MLVNFVYVLLFDRLQIKVFVCKLFFDFISGMCCCCSFFIVQSNLNFSIFLSHVNDDEDDDGSDEKSRTIHKFMVPYRVNSRVRGKERSVCVCDIHIA